MKKENLLIRMGFDYDVEDNLWCDVNPDRTRYYIRVGISALMCDGNTYAEIFNGGYSNKVRGRFCDSTELELEINKLIALNKFAKIEDTFENLIS